EAVEGALEVALDLAAERVELDAGRGKRRCRRPEGESARPRRPGGAAGGEESAAVHRSGLGTGMRGRCPASRADASAGASRLAVDTVIFAGLPARFPEDIPMLHRAAFAAALATAAILIPAPARAQDLTVDDPVLRAIWQEGMQNS